MKKDFVLAALALTLFSSCLNVHNLQRQKNLTSEMRSVKGFERIELLGSLDVKYQQADSFSVVVKAPKEVIGDVETSVEDGKLVVCMKGENKLVHFGIVDSEDVTVYVTSPDFLGIELKGSGDFEAKRLIDTDQLDIELKGSGDINFQDIVCDKANVSLIGSGDIVVEHIVAQHSNISLVGSGDVKMNQEKVGATYAMVKGSGDIKLDLQQCGTLATRVAGSGDITVSGQVTEHTNSISGSGDIHTQGLNVRKN